MVYILDLFFLPRRCNNTHRKPSQTRQLNNENKKPPSAYSEKRAGSVLDHGEKAL
ncbi:hypothetical protein [Pseudomonas sp. SWRI179]|uniref:hypothetical protein n=1 Tax=Pseudomonas sp. SWRI179 TaxID=2745497 RepID=UPI001647A68A|nr:hypothetical protein [Pseudomonas sp. SWRI179]MBC3383930.1 hypothetical protein [Pseudomonas sp. SWRI179]